MGVAPEINWKSYVLCCKHMLNNHMQHTGFELGKCTCVCVECVCVCWVHVHCALKVELPIPTQECNLAWQARSTNAAKHAVTQRPSSL